jgi:uncharacterized phage-associated protein
MKSVHDVADYFINLATQDQDILTPLKLQKLCYYAQGWHLAIVNESLFFEGLEAWVHGPVAPVLYDRFKPIRSGAIAPRHRRNNSPTFSSQSGQVLARVWQTYGGYSAKKLEEITHQELPWKNARHNCLPEDRSKNPILLEDMKKYFTSVVPALHEDTNLEHLEVFGDLYSRGLLNVKDIAKALGIEVFEVPFLLENLGAARTLEVIVMSDDEMADKLEKIRADRLARRGKPIYSKEAVLRDVVSSQRLEGIDVREWARTKVN